MNFKLLGSSLAVWCQRRTEEFGREGIEWGGILAVKPVKRTECGGDVGWMAEVKNAEWGGAFVGKERIGAVVGVFAEMVEEERPVVLRGKEERPVVLRGTAVEEERVVWRGTAVEEEGVVLRGTAVKEERVVLR